MKAFVTGASGFAGRHLCAHLRAEGDEVIASDRTGERPVDVTDRQAVHDALARTRPDVVYHLAAFAHSGESWSARTEVRRVNIDGTANVLDAARAAGVGRVLVVGTAEEYGRVTPEEVPISETAALRPTTPYGASKVAASFLALQAYLGDGLATIRVRSFNHTGPAQPPRYLIPALAARIARAERGGEAIVPVGSLEPVRDIADVRDVVRAYRAVAVAGEPGEVYNVCSGRGLSVREIAQRLLARAARPLRLVQDPDLVRPVEVPRLIGDPAKLRSATGWTPVHDLDDTLAAVLEDARRHLPSDDGHR